MKRCEAHVLETGGMAFPFRRFAQAYPVCDAPAVDWIDFSTWAGTEVNKRVYFCAEHYAESIRRAAEET